jgi:hypothetical protein
MEKRTISIFCVILALSFIALPLFAAENQCAGEKVKNFWQRLFNYPANVTKDTANIVADAGKGGVKAVTDEVKTVGQVTSGELAKTPDLVTKPLETTGEATYNAVKDTAAMPVEAAKESN